MKLPSYWLPAPAAPDDDDNDSFERLWASVRVQPGAPLIDYRLRAPKWRFLNYLAARHDLALHGSGNFEIARFEPRQPVDISSFGGQRAVYAASDAIWAMFFAIVDRERQPMSLLNAAIEVVDAESRTSAAFYVFSISQAALARRPWRTGAAYLLPRASFVAQPPAIVGALEIRPAQLASFTPVAPLARLAVAPEDFPFLEQIRGHDDARLHEYAAAMDSGAPWPDSSV